MSAAGESEAQLRQAYRWLAAGDIARAGAGFARLQTQSASAADALNGLGLCAEANGDVSGAEAAYRAALALREEPEFLNNLAICLQVQGRGAEALHVMQRLAGLAPTEAVSFNLAVLQARLGRFWEALVTTAGLLAGPAQLPEPALLMLELLKPLAYQPDTLAKLQAELAQAPAAAGWHLALAAWYDLKGQAEMAVRAFRSALQANRALLPVYSQLVERLQQQGHNAQALATARELFTRELTPESLLELLLVLQQPVPPSAAQSQAARAEYEKLLELGNASPSHGRLRLTRVPFFFAYQGEQDRPLQEKLARFLAPFVHRRDGAGFARHQPPRLGIVSAHLFRHSVMEALQGSVEALLSATDFESWLLLCPLSEHCRRDSLSEELCALARHQLELADEVTAALDQIAALELDILIFLDLGMDVYTYALAMNRLARFQLVLPGHPVTTGIPTIDYYISAESLEPPGAETFYSESLIRLPGLPDHTRPTLPPPASRSALGLPEELNLYFCPMTIFKLQPAFDGILSRILAADPAGLILLLEYKNQLHLRLRERFAAHSPELAQRSLFLPWAPQQVFFQRLLAADVILDSFPFGGGNTAYQALGLGCPIVCLDQPWHKGRWTQAMYRLMQLPDLVAADDAGYVATAVRVATQKSLQARLREQIRARSSVLFANSTWTQALLDFCRGLVEQGEGPTG